MGHSIPVMFFICESAELPVRLTTWTDAQEILTRACDDKDKYCLYSVTGRNWWQIRALNDMRDRDKLDGLGFIDQEVAIVPTAILPVAIDSIQKVISAQRRLGAIEDIPFEGISRDIECDIDGGFEAFLGALVAVLETAHKTGRVVVFVQPQP